MRKTFKSTPLGSERFRFITTYLSDECPASGQLSTHLQHQLLNMLACQPELCISGTERFSELRLFHTGAQWAAELKSEGTSPTEPKS